MRGLSASIPTADCRASSARRRAATPEGKYWKFCLDHVREYNASYNYFAGMSDNAVQAFQKDAVIGHRPTWAMGMNPTTRAAEGGEAPKAREWAYSDPLGVLDGQDFTQGRRRKVETEPKRPRYTGRGAAGP